jgi:hypothetical protein
MHHHFNINDFRLTLVGKPSEISNFTIKYFTLTLLGTPPERSDLTIWNNQILKTKANPSITSWKPAETNQATSKGSNFFLKKQESF